MTISITATLRGDDSQFDTDPILFRTKLPAIPDVGQVIAFRYNKRKHVKVEKVVWILSELTDNFELDVRVTDASK